MTKLQSALSKLIIGATLAAIASPASAWWQFVGTMARMGNVRSRRITAVKRNARAL